MLLTDLIAAAISPGRAQRFLKNSYRSKFVRNVAVVASGTAASQAIAIAFSPLITRLYGPDAFGILGAFLAIVSVLTPIAALSYPIAIVLPKEDVDARGLARLSAYISIFIGILLSILTYLAGDRLVSLLGVKEIGSLIFLVPIMVMFSGFMEISGQWLIRKRQFQITAKASVVQALLVNALNTGFGYFRPLAAVLVSMATIGNVLYSVLLTIGARKTGLQQKSIINPDNAEPSLKVLAKRYYDFPCFRTPQSFINSLSQNLPVLMLATLFSPAAAGFYSLCRRVLDMPSRLVGKSVGDVFYPRITEASHNRENLSRLILKATTSLAAIGFIPFASIVAFGPWLFNLIFGSNWIVAGVYARWLALWLFFLFINRPSIASVPALNLQKWLFLYELLLTASRVLALYLGFIIYGNDITAIILLSIIGMLFNIYLILHVVLKSRHNATIRQ